MFPGLLLFPPLLSNSGRDKYHLMSLPFVEEGETSGIGACGGCGESVREEGAELQAHGE